MRLIEANMGGPVVNGRPLEKALLQSVRTSSVDRTYGGRECHVAGWLLAIGSLSFIIGALNPALGQVWSATQDAQLRLIHDAATAWTITNVLFVLATVLNAAGMWFVPERVGNRGLAVARAATVVYLVAASVWLASLTFRLAVTPAAATTFVATGSMDPAYVLMDRWARGLFGAFTYLAGGSLVALGTALIVGRTVPAVAGGFAILVGLVIVLGYAILGDMPPFVAYLPTGFIGLVLLRQGVGSQPARTTDSLIRNP